MAAVLLDTDHLSVLQWEEQPACDRLLARLDRLPPADMSRVKTMDLRIASIAVATESMLLSRNLRDFRQVSGLRVEDWTA